MRTIILVEHRDKVWNVADVHEITENEHGTAPSRGRRLLRTINKFFEVTAEHITEYEAVGGSGIGYKRGQMIWRQSLVGCNYRKVEVTGDEVLDLGEIAR